MMWSGKFTLHVSYIPTLTYNCTSRFVFIVIVRFTCHHTICVHLSSPLVFSVFRVTQSLVFGVYALTTIVCLYYFGHCILLRLTASDALWWNFPVSTILKQLRLRGLSCDHNLNVDYLYVDVIGWKQNHRDFVFIILVIVFFFDLLLLMPFDIFKIIFIIKSRYII
jgi:hypothetical protein